MVKHRVRKWFRISESIVNPAFVDYRVTLVAPTRIHSAGLLWQAGITVICIYEPTIVFVFVSSVLHTHETLKVHRYSPK